MIFFLGIGLLFGLILGATIFLSSPKESFHSSPPTVGNSAPDFNLALLSGGNIDKNFLRGKPVIINFWATWCPPCREEMPLLEKIYQEYDNSLFVLGINVDEDEKIIGEYIQQMKISFPVGLDKNGMISRRYYARSLPVTFFIDKEGIVRGQVIGILSENLAKINLASIGVSP